MSVVRASPPSASPPEVFAGHLQHWILQATTQLAEPDSRRYFAALPSSIIRRINAAPAVSWQPIELAVTLAEVMTSALGPRATHEFHALTFQKLMASARWSSMVRTGVRLLGLSPASFVRWSARGWDGIYRHCGVVSGEHDEPYRARLVIEELPDVVYSSRPWLEAIASSYEGVFRLCNVHGVARLDDRGRPEHRLVLNLVWEP